MSVKQYGVIKQECYIRLSDGVHLACHLWLPTHLDNEEVIVPSPAILEYLPYWGSVWTAPRDTLRHPYIASHGFACVRVDMRGSGDSEGLYFDEYEKQEQVWFLVIKGSFPSMTLGRR
jgi:predicted acyl esterase